MTPWWRRERTPEPAATAPCSCDRHLDEDLAHAVVPLAAHTVDDIDDDAGDVTVGDLVEWGALGVDLTPGEDQRIAGSPHVFAWTVWLGDEVRAHYDDDALEVGVVMAEQSGVGAVEWMDREVLLVSAPSMCADGLLAAAAATLLDPRLRLAQPG